MSTVSTAIKLGELEPLLALRPCKTLSEASSDEKAAYHILKASFHSEYSTKSKKLQSDIESKFARLRNQYLQFSENFPNLPDQSFKEDIRRLHIFRAERLNARIRKVIHYFGLLRDLYCEHKNLEDFPQLEKLCHYYLLNSAYFIANRPPNGREYLRNLKAVFRKIQDLQFQAELPFNERQEFLKYFTTAVHAAQIEEHLHHHQNAFASENDSPMNIAPAIPEAPLLTRRVSQEILKALEPKRLSLIKKRIQVQSTFLKLLRDREDTLRKLQSGFERGNELKKRHAIRLLSQRGLDDLAIRDVLESFEGVIYARHGRMGETFTVVETAPKSASGIFLTKGPVGSEPADRINLLALPPVNEARCEHRVKLSYDQILLGGRIAPQYVWTDLTRDGFRRIGGGWQVITNGGRFLDAVHWVGIE